MWVDKRLNYGREHIHSFAQSSLPFSNVLDIGAGIGTDLDIIHKLNPQATLSGIDCLDVNLDMLAKKNIKPIKMNIEQDIFPFDNESLDLIVANQILEHTKELFWIMHEVSRVLKTNGRVIIGVPNLASLHNRFLLSIGRQPTPIQVFSAHIRGFTKDGFLKFLNECFSDGYKLVSTRGGNFYPFPPILAKPLAKMFPNMAWGMFLLLEKKRNYNNEFIDYPIKHSLETPFYLGDNKS